MTAHTKFGVVSDLGDRLMTLKEVAEYLHLTERTLYKWAQEGKIPASKLGSAWRFRKSDVDEWVEERKNVRQGKQG